MQELMLSDLDDISRFVDAIEHNIQVGKLEKAAVYRSHLDKRIKTLKQQISKGKYMTNSYEITDIIAALDEEQLEAELAREEAELVEDREQRF